MPERLHEWLGAGGDVRPRAAYDGVRRPSLPSIPGDLAPGTPTCAPTGSAARVGAG